MWDKARVFLDDIRRITGDPGTQIMVATINGPVVVDKGNAGHIFRPDSEQGNRHYLRGSQGQFYAGWSLRDFPGCSAYLMSTDVYVHQHFRNRGIGTRCNQFRQTIARDLRCAALMCTVVVDNLAERKVLEKENWKLLHAVKSTGGTVIDLYVKELDDV